MNFMLLVPLASKPAVEIWLETSLAGIRYSARVAQEVALRQRRDSDVEQLLERLGADDQAGMEVEVFRARLCLARKEYAAAQSLLQQTIAAHPNAVWPRVILSHVLLQEGRDWDFAEQVLRGILELEPGHAEARQNLEILLRQRRKA